MSIMSINAAFNLDTQEKYLLGLSSPNTTVTPFILPYLLIFLHANPKGK